MLMTNPDALRILDLALHHVRTRTRDPGYLAVSDRMSDLFLGVPFDIPELYGHSLGTGLTVIDTVYELLGADMTGATPSRLRATTHRLREMAELATASRSLPQLLRELDRPTCPLLEVASGLVAALTVLGHDALAAGSSPTHARDWLALWAECLLAQDRQQERSNGVCLVSMLPRAEQGRCMAELGFTAEDLMPGGHCFSEGVRGYLADFSETGATSVSLVGGLPFARALSREGLAEVLGVLRSPGGFLAILARMFRLAQDVHFDPSERLNTGIAAVAAERGIRLIDVEVEDISVERLTERLTLEWEGYRVECGELLDAILVGVVDPTAWRALAAFVEAATQVADRLVTSFHKA